MWILKHEKKIFWLVLGGMHLIFFVYQVAHQRLYMVDSFEYVQEADNILSDGQFYCGDLGQQPLRMDNFTKRPPVYPLLIAGFRAIFASDIVLLFLQNLISLGNIFLILHIANTYFSLKLRYYTLLPFLLFYPAQVIYANLVMTEILFQGMLISMVYFFLRGWETRSVKGFWAYTGLLLAGMLTKPVLYLFCIPHLILIGILAVKRKQKQLVLLAIIPAFFVWGYSQWNGHRTGYVHFSSIQNLSLLQYTTLNLLTHEEGAEKAIAITDSILYRSLDASSYGSGQELLRNECMAILWKYKWRFLAFHLKGMVNFFIDPGRFDLYHFFDVKTEAGKGFLHYFSEQGYAGIIPYLKAQPLGWLSLLLIILLFNLIKLVGLINFTFTRSVSIMGRVVVVGMILYVAGLTGSSGASRFALPVFPFLLLTIPFLFERIRRLRFFLYVFQ